MNNADLIVATLGAAGIGHGFGVPSGNVLPLIEAMHAGGIDFVLTAHEGSAAFCADVTGRLSGRPGLCIATLGPGATNLATGVGCAWLDRSPMLAVTCNLEADRIGRRIQMAIDHHALFAPITKASLALRGGEIVPTLQAAVETALAEPPGPVHLDLPEDVALMPAREAAPTSVPGRTPAPAPDAGAVAAAGRLIAGAARPLAVIGASAMRMRDPGLLRRFVEHHRLPFATTTLKREIPWLIGATALALFCLVDRDLGILDGLALLAGLAFLLYRLARIGRRAGELPDNIQSELDELPDMTMVIAGLWFLAALVVLLVSAHLVVEGAREVALRFGVSEVVVGLTVVAVGTSLPELSVTVTAVLRGHADMAIGNVVGSNILNILAVLAVPALLAPQEIEVAVLWRDYGLMVALTALLILFAYGIGSRKIITRFEGGVLVTGWVGYTYLIYHL